MASDRRKQENFTSYIYYVLEAISKTGNLADDGKKRGLTGGARVEMVNLNRINLQKIMDSVNSLILHSGKKKTISPKEIEAACQLVLPPVLAKGTINRGTEAVAHYIETQSTRQGSKDNGETLIPMSRSVMAGLNFPVTRTSKLMSALSIASRKSDTSSVYMAAVCEFLICEVLLAASKVAIANGRQRITTRHILLAIKNDRGLCELYSNAIFAGGVVVDEKKTATKKPASSTTVKKKKVTKGEPEAASSTTAKKTPVKKTPPAAKKRRGRPKAVPR